MNCDRAPSHPTKPVLLYNGECAVCRHIAQWVLQSARSASGDPSIVERPIGDDPEALALLNPDLDIWDAYATVHLLMPDGSIKTGGEAVAEVLRRVPGARWFSWTFAAGIGGFRPFQLLLDACYAALAAVRPLLGCESCGSTNVWVRSIARTIAWGKAPFAKSSAPHRVRHFAAATARRSRPAEPKWPTAATPRNSRW
ncbi:MAG: DCC1-like thiol-disulfide oxidoreductase family protein [Candidatus Velthaea sp.]|jgi:predicted DCC family thiol-disulfide oxidoreductase YuxK